MKLPVLVTALFTFFSAGNAAEQQRQFDPCQTAQEAKLGKPYVFAFAYLPGGDWSKWAGINPETNQTVWRNPCVAADRAALGGLNASVAVYSGKVGC